MKATLCLLMVLAAIIGQGCSTTKEPMDSVRYEKAVQKQFDDEYQERLKQ